MQKGARKWVEEQMVIQDFCLLFARTAAFLQELAIFPLWLCPLKGTSHPQIFAPHVQRAYVLN